MVSLVVWQLQRAICSLAFVLLLWRHHLLLLLHAGLLLHLFQVFELDHQVVLDLLQVLHLRHEVIVVELVLLLRPPKGPQRPGALAPQGL